MTITSDILAVANGVVDALESSAFSPVAATASLSLRPKDRPSDLASPKIIVQPAGHTVTRETRGTFSREVVVNIGVAQQLSGNSLLYSNTISTIMRLIEQVADRLRSLGIQGEPPSGWQWASEERVVVLDEEMVRENAIVFCQIAVTFQRIY